MGEPAGIGPDIIIAAWQQRQSLQLPQFVVYADPEALRARSDVLGARLTINVTDRLPLLPGRDEGSLTVIDIGPQAATNTPGRPDTANAAIVIAAIEGAVAAVARGHAKAVVTAPIAKHVLYEAGFNHPGHTEFLGELAARHWNVPPPHPVMMLVSDELLVVPLTIHVPLAEVPALITGQLITNTAHKVLQALTQDFSIASPRLAIAGLNPHAGENGTLGREDSDVIAPAIEALAAEGHRVSGPYSADVLFHTEARRGYDAVLAMYHDQALIPIKTLAFDSGVNATLGLPFIRTSPDHGTAFDIAGTGRASATSFVAALRLAERLANARLDQAQ